MTSRAVPARRSGSTLAEAIRGFTLGSAYVNHLDDDTGSIEAGKLADLAVIDRDLFDAGRGTDRRRQGRRSPSSAARSSSRTRRSGEGAGGTAGGVAAATG